MTHQLQLKNIPRMLPRPSRVRHALPQTFISSALFPRRTITFHAQLLARREPESLVWGALVDSVGTRARILRTGTRRWKSESTFSQEKKDAEGTEPESVSKPNSEPVTPITEGSPSPAQSELQSHVTQAEPSMKVESGKASTFTKETSERYPTTKGEAENLQAATYPNQTISSSSSTKNKSSKSPSETAHEVNAAPTVPYSNDELSSFFDHTSSEWLYNAEEQKRIRHLEFDVDALIDAAVKATGASSCTRFKKYNDGLFNRTFEITLNTGKSVIAKLPFSSAGPKRFTTASEVATMHFVRNVLAFPAPHVYAYSCDAEAPSNPVKAEYIVMEKLEGVPLDLRWNDWSNFVEQDMKALIAEIVIAQSTMTSVEFPGLGSLYFQEDLPDDVPCAPMEVNYTKEALEGLKEGEKAPETRVYMLGPSVDRNFWRDGRAELDIYRGPWKNLEEYMLSVVDCEIAWLRTKAKPHPLGSPRYLSETQNSPEHHVQLLEKYRKVLPYFVPANENFLKCVLQMPHFNSLKIFVPESGFMKVTSYSDWQGSFVGVLMNLYDTPDFLDYPGGKYIERPILDPQAPLPKLPENIDQLNKEQQFIAQVEQARAVEYKLYHDFTHAQNPVLYEVKKAREPEFCLSPLMSCMKIWEEGSSSFMMLLVQVIESWAELVPGKPCPISFTNEEYEECENAMQDWMLRGSVATIAEGMGLTMDTMVPEDSLEHMKKMAGDILELLVNDAEEEKEKEDIKRVWPLREGAMSLTAQTCH